MSVHCGWLGVAEGPAWAFADPPDASSSGFFFLDSAKHLLRTATLTVHESRRSHHHHRHHHHLRHASTIRSLTVAVATDTNKDPTDRPAWPSVWLSPFSLQQRRPVSQERASDTEATDEDMQRMSSNGAQMWPVHAFIKFRIMRGADLASPCTLSVVTMIFFVTSICPFVTVGFNSVKIQR